MTGRSATDTRPPAARKGKGAASEAVDHWTVVERVARGKAARGGAPRSDHAEFCPADDRPDPVSLLQS